MNFGCRIAGVGAYLPRTVVTNEFFAQQSLAPYSDVDEMFDGMVERRHAAPDETAVHMGTEAAREALERAGATPESVDYVLWNGVAQDYHIPTDGPFMMEKLGLRNARYMFMDIACASGVAMMAHAELLIRTGRATKVLIVACCAWVHRQIDKSKDYSVPGDGAGAILIERSADSSFIALSEKTFPQYALATHLEAPWVTHESRWLSFKVNFEYRKWMVDGPIEVARQAMLDGQALGARPKWTIMHQAGKHLLEHWSRKLEMPPDTALNTVAKTGNLGPANTPVVLHHFLYENPLIKKGDVVLFFSPGAGVTANALLWRI